MDEITDLLQVRIEKAKTELPPETSNAIAAVDWKAAIIGLRAKKGYTFEQLGDLELETELLLCGLVSPENYPKELSNRMRISGAEANELVNEMNSTIFKRIREELIKNVERKKIFAKREAESQDVPTETAPRPSPIPVKEKVAEAILKSAGIEIVDKKEPTSIVPSLTELPSREEMLKKIEKPELIKKDEEIHPLLAQKFASTFQIPMVQTEYSLPNVSKVAGKDNSADDMNTPPSPEPIKKPEVSSSAIAKMGLPANVLEKIKLPPSDDSKISKPYSVNADPYRMKPE